MLESWYKTDLSRPVPIRRMAGSLFEGDSDANLIGFTLIRDGAEAPLSSGAVRGYVTKADGSGATIAGSMRNGMPYVILTSACYAEIGGIKIVVKVNDMTVGAVVGSVAKTTTGETV